MVSAFPGYTRIIGPESLEIPRVLRVRTPADYRTWQMIIVTARGGRVWITGVRVPAYINAGRWTADCHWCAKGMFTRPDWALACCGECGALYEPGTIVFPDQADAAVQILLRRPNRDSQNWRNPNLNRPLQTIEDLARENIEELQL